MTGNRWPYHHCLRCGTPIQSAGSIWCDQCTRDADAELADMAGGQP